MKLQTVSLSGRRFYIHFLEIMNEFGREIPWLDGLYELRYATDGKYFCQELLRRTGQKDHVVTPYQFVENNAPQTFIGGILHFGKSPEKFKDTRHLAIEELLAIQGSSFVSCLQVRPQFRSEGIGREMNSRAITSMLKKFGSVWGVVSDYRLARWYQSMGAEILSPLENKDQLWIVRW